MAERLKIQKRVAFDESIAHCEIHAHLPFASSTFKNNDEIRITVQNQDLCLLPSKSSLHISGKMTKSDNTRVAVTTKMVNMAVCHLFEEIRYELNSVEIDRSKKVGITSVMKGYLSLSPGQRHLLENTGWLCDDDELTNPDGYFDVVIPLNFLLGFAEDYRRVIVNAKHELILTRSNIDLNAVIQTAAATEAVRISLDKIEWLMLYVKLADNPRPQLLNYIAKDPEISMSFRAWEMYEYPLLPQATRHVWVVKTSTQLEKPRHVVLGFQTARGNSEKKNASQFDHCSI